MTHNLFSEGSSPCSKVSYSYVSSGKQVLVHKDIRSVPEAIFHVGCWVLLSTEGNGMPKLSDVMTSHAGGTGVS